VLPFVDNDVPFLEEFMHRSHPHARIGAGAVAAIGLIAALLVPSQAAVSASDVTLEVVSSRPDAVTAGDALISVAGADDSMTITAAGVDVTDRFAALGGAFIGLVDGLPDGVSEIKVLDAGGSSVAEIEVTNHPAWGPVFSGPQHPMYCTASDAPWNLGPTDENCHVAEPVVSYRYRTTGGAFADYPTDGSTPGDLVTTTVDGEEVPYIVRIERGTINRAVYEFAVLGQPDDPVLTPWTAGDGWNGKLAYTFGGACGVGYWQGTSTGGVENDLLLSRGYAVASGTFNVYAQNCNDVTSAETATMVKEHVVESLGPLEYTIGFGGSAGTMQQLLLSNNYPGIIDGVLGEIGYPDERSTTVAGHDCRNLLNYWNSDEGAGWSDAEKLAVTGHASTFTCFGFTFFDGVDDPNRGCNSAIPVADRWSPSNPERLRCTIADMVKNVYGVDSEGRGLRIVPDNVGVQYGLNALLDEEISIDKFLSLNANAGGMDVDGARTEERSVASVAAIERAFETGRINMMTGGLEYIPVIEIRPYTDMQEDFHERYRSAIIRERMLAAWGNADTHVSWTSSTDPTISAAMRASALDRLEEWLDAIIEAGGPGDRARTVAARPDGLSDGCFDSTGDFIVETVDYSDPTTACNTLYPYHSEPRYEAGEPLSRDVMKCQLVAPQRSDYPTMTDPQWDELQATFPDGVCDWTQPSQGYAELAGTWLDFGTTQRAALTGPAIAGDPYIGETLTGDASSSTGGAALAFQWLADGVPIDGADGSTFVPTGAQDGARITLRVTASADGFVAVTTVSEPTVSVSARPDPTDPAPDPSETPGEAWAAVTLSSTSVVQGGSFTVNVAGLAPGQQVGATVYSDPYVVTGIPPASSSGTVTFTVAIPADFTPGAHTLEITSGTLDPIRIGITVQRGGDLGALGANAPWGLALAAALMIAIGGVVVMLRRRSVFADGDGDGVD